MSLNKKNILKIAVTTESKKIILEEIEKWLFSSKTIASKSVTKKRTVRLIVTPNPEQIVYSFHHPHFKEILNQADVALPDGIGLVWASKILSSPKNSFPIASRIAGVEFMDDLVGLAAKWSVRIALMGGREGVAVKAFECLQQKYPKLNGWAADAPVISIEKNEDIDANSLLWVQNIGQKVIKSGVGLVFIGLGVPKQKY